jgi:hypothetical protein
MRSIVSVVAMTLVITAGAGAVFAHHAADGIVDEEIYAMIDAMVADTPHADMTLDDLGGGMTEMTITTRTVRSLESMITGGLLTYLSMLDGDVQVDITFGDRGEAEMVVTQVE